MVAKQELLNKRDAKAKPHLEQYAPVWMLAEKIIAEDEAVQFDVVFQHHQYGWVKRRYRYDAFNNVLYYRGQTLVTDDELIAVQAREPYVSALVANVPNAYGG
jgi:hypothetical protein